MTNSKSSIKAKPIIRERKHKCVKEEILLSQSKAIDQVHEWLAGNHDPENGMIYKMIDTIKSIDDINKKLTNIDIIVGELHEESKNKKVYVKTAKEEKAERRAVWLKWIQTFMFIVAAIGLSLTAYFGFRGNNKQDAIIINQDDIKQKQENLGVPIIVNNRGEMMTVPDSTRILYFSNDSMTYRITRIKK
jgi:hypothetical protein